jgi:hypothetical protein
LERAWGLSQVTGRYGAECLVVLFALVMGVSLWACYPYARRVHLQEQAVWDEHSEGEPDDSADPDGHALGVPGIGQAAAVLADTRCRLEQVSGQLDQTS